MVTMEQISFEIKNLESDIKAVDRHIRATAGHLKEMRQRKQRFEARMDKLLRKLKSLTQC